MQDENKSDKPIHSTGNQKLGGINPLEFLKLARSFYLASQGIEGAIYLCTFLILFSSLGRIPTIITLSGFCVVYIIRVIIDYYTRKSNKVS